MPVGFYFPEKILNYGGVTLYAVYNNDHQTDGRHPYYYGTSIHASAEGCDVIDVRALPNYREDVTHASILKEAIENGWIVQKEDVAIFMNVS